MSQEKGENKEREPEIFKVTYVEKISGIKKASESSPNELLISLEGRGGYRVTEKFLKENNLLNLKVGDRVEVLFFDCSTIEKMRLVEKTDVSKN